MVSEKLFHRRGRRVVLLAAGSLLLAASAARAEVERVTVRLEEARCFS